MTEAQLEILRARVNGQRSLRPGASFAELELLLNHIDDLEMQIGELETELTSFVEQHETCVEPPDDFRLSLAELWAVIPGAPAKRAAIHQKESA